MFEFMSDFYAKPDQTLALHSQEVVDCAQKLFQLGYIRDESLLFELKIACRDHDLGKINSSFQKRVKSKEKKNFDENTEVGHNVISAYLTDIEEELKTCNSYFRVVNAVLNHHHYVDNYWVIGNKEILIKQVLHEIEHSVDVFKKYADDIGSPDALFRRLQTEDWNEIRMQIAPKIRAILLKGLLMRCDHAASAREEIEYPNDFLEKAMRNMGYHWNELQKFCMDHKENNLIISAPTGMGKTEAAFLWIGNAKGIYTLPLQVAINAIYDRLKTQILKDEGIDYRLGVLHGNSLSYLIGQESRKENKSLDIDYNNAVFKYYDRIKSMSLPLIITTPDQIFNFVYRYEGYESKLAILSYSKVVIDEIQAYSPDLLAYLVYGIGEIVKVGGKFAIFTATFPPFIRDLILKECTDSESAREKEQKEINDEIKAINSEYGAKGSGSKFFYQEDIDNFPVQADFTFDEDVKSFGKNRRHHLKLEDRKMDANAVIENISGIYEKDSNSKILIVCNTVKQAQEFYLKLKEVFSDESDVESAVNLLHAKFIKKHRAKKEKQILADGQTFEKDGMTLKKKKVIWISTQIVEASLDIDFDYLFTELTDLNGLFQRLGRCNRKGVKPVDEPNCFVFLEMDNRLFINENATKGFIDRSIHELSKKALESYQLKITELANCSFVLSEKEKMSMIEEFLTTKNLKSDTSEYMNRYRTMYDNISELYIGEKSLAQVKKEFRNIQSYQSIPCTFLEDKEYQSELDDILNKLSENEMKLDEQKRSLKVQKQEMQSESVDDEKNIFDIKSEISKLKLERIKLKNEFSQYLLNVGYFDLSRKNDVEEEFKEIKDEKIFIAAGNYNEEIGFVREIGKKKKSVSRGYSEDLNLQSEERRQEESEVFDLFF